MRAGVQHGLYSVRPTSLIDDEFLLQWVQRLIGLDEVRIREATAQVTSWNVSHINRELLTRPSIDSAVAVTQISEAVRALKQSGIPETKLMAKLRRDRDVWPTWAELRAAALMLRVTGAELILEADRPAGKHSDFQFSLGGGPPVAVEFKAIGLSDEEADFCRRSAPALDQLLPPAGLLTLHAELATVGIRIDADGIQAMNAAAAATAGKVPNYPSGLAGVTIVGHGGEDNYARRLWLRLVNELARQIPQNGESWGAFYWTNGAPTRAVLRALRSDDFPKGLAGVILLGDSVAFPAANIHSFVVILPRGTDGEGAAIVTSEVDDNLATAVFERFERSSGVRATLLVATDAHQKRELLRRDGTRRILPFNLLIDEDPEQAPKGPSRSESRAR